MPDKTSAIYAEAFRLEEENRRLAALVRSLDESRNAAESALAAARRECDLLRARFEKVAEFHEEQLRLLDSEPAKEWAGSDKTGYYAAWKTAHTVAAHEAREALAAPGAASTPRKHWPDCALNHGGTACDMGPDCGTEGHLDAGGTWRVTAPAAAAGEDSK